MSMCTLFGNWSDCLIDESLPYHLCKHTLNIVTHIVDARIGHGV